MFIKLKLKKKPYFYQFLINISTKSIKITCFMMSRLVHSNRIEAIPGSNISKDSYVLAPRQNIDAILKCIHNFSSSVLPFTEF